MNANLNDLILLAGIKNNFRTENIKILKRECFLQIMRFFYNFLSYENLENIAIYLNLKSNKTYIRFHHLLCDKTQHTKKNPIKSFVLTFNSNSCTATSDLIQMTLFVCQQISFRFLGNLPKKYFIVFFSFQFDLFMAIVFAAMTVNAITLR